MLLSRPMQTASDDFVEQSLSERASERRARKVACILATHDINAFVPGITDIIEGRMIAKNGDTVGMRMVRLDAHEGFAADTAAAGALLAASLAGIPVSTTHMKTTALMGVSASRRLRAVNWRVAGEMAWAWALTFPGCGAVGYLTARLFLWWL